MGHKTDEKRYSHAEKLPEATCPSCGSRWTEEFTASGDCVAHCTYGPSCPVCTGGPSMASKRGSASR